VTGKETKQEPGLFRFDPENGSPFPCGRELDPDSKGANLRSQIGDQTCIPGSEREGMYSERPPDEGLHARISGPAVPGCR
jgi:hypothetical protein